MLMEAHKRYEKRSQSAKQGFKERVFHKGHQQS